MTYTTFAMSPFLKQKGSTSQLVTASGNYRTESLFYEIAQSSGSERPVFTFAREDMDDPKVPGRTIYSFAKEYMALLDPTGYKPAMLMLGSYAHWLRLLKNEKIQEYVSEWNEEITAALKSLGYETYVKAAKGGDLKAADWLMKQSEPEGIRPKRGRPPNPAPDTSVPKSETDADAKRLGLG